MIGFPVDVEVVVVDDVEAVDFTVVANSDFSLTIPQVVELSCGCFRLFANKCA